MRQKKKTETWEELYTDCIMVTTWRNYTAKLEQNTVMK